MDCLRYNKAGILMKIKDNLTVIIFLQSSRFKGW